MKIMVPKSRVFLICNTAFAREGLAAHFKSVPSFRLVGTAGTLARAVLPQGSDAPDVLVLDPASLAHTVTEAVQAAREAWPSLPILVFTSLDETDFAFGCFRAGVQGFLHASADLAELSRALELIVRGETYISPRFGHSLLTAALAAGSMEARPGATSVRLTQRQEDVLNAIERGLSTREIAQELKLSGKTVESHRQNLKNKLQFRTERDLIEYCRSATDEAEGQSGKPLGAPSGRFS